MDIVFFGDVSGFTAAHLRRCLAAGHRITAFVVAERLMEKRLRRERPIGLLAPRWSVGAQLRKAGIPVIATGVPIDAAALSARLAPLGGEVLVCVAFLGRIPAAVRELYPRGAINVHPALLPDYRGPHPLHVMRLNGRLAQDAGVTVHAMTEGFDEGPILAQARLADAGGPSPSGFGAALARLGADLLDDTLRNLDRRMAEARPQPQGTFVSGRLGPGDLTFEAGVGEDRLAGLLRVAEMRVFPQLRVGETSVQIVGPLRRIGPRSGAAPKLRAFSAEFDTAERRVRVRRARGLQRRLLAGRQIARLVVTPGA